MDNTFKPVLAILITVELFFIIYYLVRFIGWLAHGRAERYTLGEYLFSINDGVGFGTAVTIIYHIFLAVLIISRFVYTLL